MRKDLIEMLRQKYPVGLRVELTHMDDPHSRLTPGCKGTVMGVDDIGTIHVQWDNGSHLGVVFGKDTCKLIGEKQNVKKS